MSQLQHPLGPDTELLVRVDEDLIDLPANERVELEETLPITFIGTRLPDGRNAIPAFTSEDELLAWWPEGGPWVGMALVDLLEVVFQRDNDLVLVDPASEERDNDLVLVDPASEEPTEITRSGN